MTVFAILLAAGVARAEREAASLPESTPTPTTAPAPEPGTMPPSLPSGPARVPLTPIPPTTPDEGPGCGPDGCCGTNGTCAPKGRFWVEGDALLWWVKGAQVPPLVTTSPPGTPQSMAGVLGVPGTEILFGGTGFTNSDLRAGGRIDLGYWFDCKQTFGIETDFFMLENKATNFSAFSNGSQILARPFVDATTGAQSSELIAFPGLLAGGVVSTVASEGLIGTGGWLREALLCGCCYRVDLLAGYRYLRFADRLGLSENPTSLSANNPFFVPVGSTLVLTDRFDTKNEFNGFDVGLTGEVRRDRWIFGWLAKLAVGENYETLAINGSTVTTVPGMAPVTRTGGLLALQSNIGNYSRTDTVVIPEFGLKLGYQVNDHMRLYAGYTLLYWSTALRAGDQIDTTINPNLLPPVTTPVTGPQRPAVSMNTTDVWFQGISLGVEFRF
jgi:hypothetical protein